MIFTFYSYKGGVGRSMAMAGIAHLFARRGLRVLAIDFDLEAPGLERYFFDGEHCRSIRAQPGLMDLIKAYRLALSNESAFQQAEFKRWDKFKLTAISVAGSLGGSVDLMTAGQREPENKLREYALAVRSFDWQDFFHNWKGDLFFDWLRRQIRDPESGYDVVLVDSRTGVTEMGGVCAYQLADAAVLLCAPNYQNLEGTRDVARDFRSDSVLGLRQGRPLEIVAVPARVEATHPRVQEFLEAFEHELGVDGMPKLLAEAGLTYAGLALPYLPQFAVVERLVGDNSSNTDSARPAIDVFEQLADALTLLAEPESRLGRQRQDALVRLRGGEIEKPAELVADTSQSSAGYDAFIDYSQGDALIARELHASLERAGFNIFLDATSLRPGADWRHAVDQALDYSHALLVCFGQATDTEARARLIARARRLQRVRIIPILLPGADPNALASFDLSELQALDLRSWPNNDALNQVIASLSRQGRTTAEPQPPVAEREPYPGMQPYTEDDSAYFSGREYEAEELRAAIATRDVVLLSGPAKVGKTSLLKAGLMRSIRPGGSWSTEFQLGSLAWIDYTLDIRPRWPDWLNGFAAREATDTRRPNLVVIDSIDDFGSDGSVKARQDRLAEIRSRLRSAGPLCKFVLCWRDVLPDAEREPALNEWQQHSFKRIDLEPLRGERLRKAIEEPAKRAGHLLEPGLTDRLIESAGSAYNAIAQIQLALAAIWPERRRGWLTNKNLDAAGHLGGVFDQHRAGVLRALNSRQVRGAEVLFKSLVVLDSSFKLVPVTQPWPPIAAVPAIARADAVALRDQLASAGLIDLRRATHPSAGTSLATLDVQIALVRPNPAVYFGGADAAPDLRFLMWRSELATLVLRWRSTQSGADALLRGSALSEARSWLADRVDELTQAERDFIDASISVQEQLEADERARAQAERDAFEARERERSEAAERLAAERGERLKTEELAHARAQEDAKRLKRRGKWLVGLLMASTGLLVVAAVQTFNERIARNEAFSQMKVASAALSNAERSAAEARRAEKIAQDRLVSLLAQFGWSSDDRHGATTEQYSVRQSLQANQVLQSVTKPDERERRKAVRVEYFAKNADESKVEAALIELGFTLRKPQALVKGIASNAIWFGSPVRTEDVKLVALTLIRAGVQLKSIRPIPDHLTEKKDALLIQVGADVSVEKDPPYTVEQIQAAKQFSR